MSPAQHSPRDRSPSRFAWVDIAKGICIAAVVCLYTFNTLHNIGVDPGWLTTWTAFAKPFRMPDFFLISGLFLSRVIDRPWRSYLDTKVLHYFYFIALWSIFIYLWNWGNLIPEMGVLKSLKLFAYIIYRPEAMLWFIQTLALYFVVTRLLRFVPSALLLLFALWLRLSEYHTGIYPIDWFGEFYLFFLCGYVFANFWFAVADFALQRKVLAWGFLGAWVVFNQMLVASGATAFPVVLLATGMIGITAVVVLSSLINQFSWAQGFRYLGKNSIVVYLGFYLPLQWMGWWYAQAQTSINHHLLGAAMVVLSLGAAVLLHVATRKTALRFLFERPDWARIAGSKSPASPTHKAQAPVAAGSELSG